MSEQYYAHLQIGERWYEIRVRPCQEFFKAYCVQNDQIVCYSETPERAFDGLVQYFESTQVLLKALDECRPN